MRRRLKPSAARPRVITCPWIASRRSASSTPISTANLQKEFAMLTTSRLVASLLLLSFVFHAPLRAQERAPESRPAPVVTATLTAERVRFTAPSNITTVRLEVYTSDGQRLFDT